MPITRTLKLLVTAVVTPLLAKAGIVTITAVALIYNNLETSVAHRIFK